MVESSECACCRRSEFVVDILPSNDFLDFCMQVLCGLVNAFNVRKCFCIQSYLVALLLISLARTRIENS
jgi:hypothetical protein